jgi:hypothetical protein
MSDKDLLQNHNEVQILLPNNCCFSKYKFENIKEETIEQIIYTTTTIKEVKICFSGIENNLWRYQVLCVNLDIEAKHISSTTILKKQINVFDELIFYVNQNGTIIDIFNLDQLQKRWQEAKVALHNKNQGSILDDFIADTDELLKDKKNVLKYISSKEMYGLYFNGCWGYHDITKPRFEGLMLNIEKRKIYDQHTKHLQQPYSHDVQVIYNTADEQKVQESFFEYKNHKLVEAFLEINEPDINSKYSIVCLTI